MKRWCHKILMIIPIVFLASRLYCQPSVYFSTRDVSRLRQKAKKSHGEIFFRIRSAVDEMKRKPNNVIPSWNWTVFSKSWNEIYGNNLACLSFYCLINETDQEAFRIAKTAIQRFISLPNWRCALNLEDDVPVAHSLVGMATTYDFLRHRLYATEQKKMELKVINVTRELYDRSLSVWWGKTYIQNHVATNYVALLIGALAVRTSTKEAEKWIERANLMLNRTMFLLEYVNDGSLEEGVAYGSYTTRSLTQYIFLAKRHLKIDHTNNPWLHKHFWFLYHTILPTFDKTIGIADSTGGWFFGPGSQLVFLDSMVLKTGWGNWLAKHTNEARRTKNLFKQSKVHRFATFHTEFLFYDNTYGVQVPPVDPTAKLHEFKDWGVVTYAASVVPSSGWSKAESSSLTFLSFKCGVLHGTAVNKIVKTRPWSWIEGWRSFNPGHEHPDHGSFTFYPNGVPFITDALYGPKYTWLNNVVMFENEDAFVGQIGEGRKWMGYKSMTHWMAEGTIITAIHENDKVFIVGEYSRWYPEHLGIEKLYRNLILLQEDLLIVFDVVFKKSDSTSGKISAFFHNRFQEFQIHQDKLTNTSYAELLNNGSHRIQWISSDDKNIQATKHNAKFKAEYHTRQSNFVNITSSIKNGINSIVFVFSGPNLVVLPVQVNVDDDKSTLVLEFNSKRYTIAVLLRPDETTAVLRTMDDYVSIAASFTISNYYLVSIQVTQIIILIVIIIIIAKYFKLNYYFLYKIVSLKSKKRLVVVLFVVFIVTSFLCDSKRRSVP